MSNILKFTASAILLGAKSISGSVLNSNINNNNLTEKIVWHNGTSTNYTSSS